MLNIKYLKSLILFHQTFDQSGKAMRAAKHNFA